MEKMVAKMVKEKLYGKTYKKVTFFEMVVEWVKDKISQAVAFVKVYVVTYDVCEHDGWEQEMNTYEIEVTKELYVHAWEYAKKDYAPLVIIYDTSWEEIAEHEFLEYSCHCED